MPDIVSMANRKYSMFEIFGGNIPVVRNWSESFYCQAFSHFVNRFIHTYNTITSENFHITIDLYLRCNTTGQCWFA